MHRFEPHRWRDLDEVRAYVVRLLAAVPEGGAPGQRGLRMVGPVPGPGSQQVDRLAQMMIREDLRRRKRWAASTIRSLPGKRPSPGPLTPPDPGFAFFLFWIRPPLWFPRYEHVG